MQLKSLSKIFSPNSIAIIGASHERGKVGYEIVNNLLNGKFKKEIFLINPKGGKILGKKVFKNIFEVKEKIDLAIIVVPSIICPQVLEEVGQEGIKYAIIISAGFKEFGVEGAKIEEKIKKIAEKYEISFLGPNCLGLINPYQNLNASFGANLPEKKGNIFFLSQSGAILCGFLDLADQNNLGFSKIVSLGNKANLSENDFLEFALNDPQTKVVLAYLESFVDGKKTIEILKNNPQKPLILLKAGVSEKGKKAASLHTGSLAGSNEAFEAFIKKTNVIKADSLKDLFNLVKGFSFQNLSEKNKIAILTNAGGLGVLGTDAIEKFKVKSLKLKVESSLELVKLNEETKDFLRKKLPLSCSLENPVDIIGDAKADRYKIALEAILKDKNVSAVLVFLTPQKMTEPEKTAEIIVSFFKKYKKPIFTCFFGQKSVEKAIKILEKNNIPNFDTPEKAVEVIQKMLGNNQIFEETKNINQLIISEKQKIEKVLDKACSQKNLEPEKVAEILKICKIPYPKFVIAFSEDEAINKAKELFYPLAMKTAGSEILHKQDVGGVKLNLKNEQEVKKAYQEIVKNISNIAGDKNNKEIKKVIIQEMVTSGEEIIIGMKRDEQFGPLIMFGLGGIFVEVLKDVSFGIAPLNYNEAKEMIYSIKGYDILKGARGGKEKDIDSIIEILLKISELSIAFPQIKEIDLNPVKVFEKGYSILDFKFILF
ncbi:MAG: acetate--CoA ligase family protein [Patescibacteria group bacterium]|nr:acetate--CoA ligase family protein [Patescibacteria group bacterium]MBU1783272.1 acetate--CoA ligase family protein [Patescibacteria group bacterium]MBU2081287.1 acetate--CoA ligase family protein [Patescibacteria group bacterium]MBU2250070.1 acetate--CoA ligase family protein [Patescibacteria group bacterium]